MIAKWRLCPYFILLLGMNWKKMSLFIAGFLCLLLVAFVSKNTVKSNYEVAREIIVMRKIAHELLLYSGDSSSRILPVNQLHENEFEIPFEASFSFTPDSLVRIIDKVISANKLPSTYIVNVKEIPTQKVIFGYAFSGNQQKSIVPCLGREQPTMRYSINIQFPEDAAIPANTIYMAAMGLLGLGLFLFGVKQLEKTKLPVTKETAGTIAEKPFISIGKYAFYPEQQLLVFDNEKADLTIKESKLLHIFATDPNQVIDRNKLQKVWEDEGVIVGRSLDMFVSRLRKKLENDAAVKIVNIHGKGYKLEINEESI